MSDSPNINPSKNPDARWPAESLRVRPVELNRMNLRDSSFPHLRGRESWPNQSPEAFAEELEAAQKVGVTSVGPHETGFAELMHSCERFHWAILLDGFLRRESGGGPYRRELRFVRTSHGYTELAGDPVLAAGEGCVKSGDFLSNTTGHFRNDDYVVGPVKDAFSCDLEISPFLRWIFYFKEDWPCPPMFMKYFKRDRRPSQIQLCCAASGRTLADY